MVLWDGRTRVPAQAAVVIPLNNSEGVAAVTAMAMCWAAGILAVGHKDGYLRLYQAKQPPSSPSLSLSILLARTLRHLLTSWPRTFPTFSGHRRAVRLWQ